MFAFTKPLYAAGITLLFATPAFAQQGSPWEIQEGECPCGRHARKDEGDAAQRQNDGLKKRARPVPKGMIFFMNNGQL
jgi:hypothetical protein